ncbi:MAG: type II secretion system protein GspG [Planctomycetes bacterium]|nr:type II secretion system protein GspG [Planctomycetota bacterium]
MEIMLVLVILVVLASASGLALLAFRRRAMNNAAMDGIRTTEMAVDAYLLDNGRLPENLEILYAPVDRNDRYLDSEPLDPWKSPYNYEPGTGEEFLISSNGPDQAQGGDDDIFSPKNKQNANQ